MSEPAEIRTHPLSDFDLAALRELEAIRVNLRVMLHLINGGISAEVQDSGELDQVNAAAAEATEAVLEEAKA